MSSSDDAVIAVVGMGAVTPGANNPDELWDILSGETHFFTTPTRFDVTAYASTDKTTEDRTHIRESGFITNFYSAELQEEVAQGILPSHESTTTWLRHALRTALATVGHDQTDRFFAAFGFTADGSQDLEDQVVGSGYLRLGAEAISESMRANLARRYQTAHVRPYDCLPHRIGRNALVGLLPDKTELVMVDTACSSSFYSLDLAVKALRESSCDVAVCGGAFGHTARDLVLFAKINGLSQAGQVRCFDSEADGVLFSDGAAVLVLKTLMRARADGDTPLGIIDGVGLACDGRGKAIYAPKQDGQEHALRRAYTDADLSPSMLSWMIAHATGTPAGDSTEIRALTAVAGSGPKIPLSSNKAIVGHTGWAAGAVSVIHALSGLRHGTVPAQRYLSQPIPDVETSRFTPPRAAPVSLPADRPRRVGINAFGFGGTDAHVIVSEAIPTTPVRTARAPLSSEDIVITGWTAVLPGDPTVPALASWLHKSGPAPALSFGEEPPLPQFTDVPLPPRTVRNMDPTQILLLRAATNLPEQIRAACARLHQTTGVIVAHMGPTRRAIHYALRCHLGELERCAQNDDHAALQRIRADVQKLVPPSTEDSFPGFMPNIIAARLASVWDLCGLSMTIDTGPDAALDAIRTAERHLRHRSLEFALVGAVNGNISPEIQEILADGGITRPCAEGAFLLAMTRQSVAEAERLPVLARLNSCLADRDATSSRAFTPTDRTYLAGDAMLAVLSCLTDSPGTRSIGCTESWGTHVQVTVPSPQTSFTRAVRRSVIHIAEAPARPVRTPVPALPTGSLLISTESAAPSSPDVRVVIVPDEELPSDALSSLIPPGEFDHIRVVTELGASGTHTRNLGPMSRLRTLHDLAYLAAQRWSGRVGDSYGFLGLNAVHNGIPHPATALFTGLVKSLARENSDATCLSVLTDHGDLHAGLALLSAETGHQQYLNLSIHTNGRRYACTVDDAPSELYPSGDIGLTSDSVVVATGGARGITAELLAALAQTARPTIYLLGRTQDIQVAGTLPARAEYLNAHRHDTPDTSVNELSAAYDRLTAAVNIKATLDRLSAYCAPGKVHYLTCDVTDTTAVEAAFDHIHSHHDRIDLLINAAGTHYPGNMKTTPLVRMQEVRDTKLLGYLNLSRALAARPPVRWVNIGSIIAVLGWPGEAGYCSGNDFLGAAARWSRAFPGSPQTTLAMPMWKEAGFTADRATLDLLRRQATLTGVSNRDGTGLFIDELASARNEPEITYLGAAERNLLQAPNLSAGPHRDHRARRPETYLLDQESDLVYRYTPDLTVRDAHLRGHLLGRHPVVPAALIVGLSAEAATRAICPLALTDLCEFTVRLPMWATAPGGYRVELEPSESEVRISITSTLSLQGMGKREREHAHLRILLQPREVRPYPNPIPSSSPRLGMAVIPPWYKNDAPLQLSGVYRSLTNIVLTPDHATAVLEPLQPAHRSLNSMRIIDAMIQLSLLRTSGADMVRAVPTGIGQIHLFDELQIPRADQPVFLVADPDFTIACRADGNPLAQIESVSTGPILQDRTEVAAG